MKSPTKHHHTGQAANPGEMLTVISTFLGTCRSPALLEYGDELLPLIEGNYTVELRSGRLWIDAWHEQRSVSRRIVAVEGAATGMLDCLIHRFAGQTGKLTFLDLNRPQTTHRRVAGERGTFAEQFRRMLARQFPAWETQSLTTSMDLRRSLSPIYPRARLTRGNQQIAAIACPDKESEAGLLTFALLWFDHLRRYSENAQLCLFLPDICGALTAQRLRWLASETLRPRVFRYNAHGSAGEVDPQDLGNIETRVSPHCKPVHYTTEIANLLTDLRSIDGVGLCPELNGQLSIRCRGVQFARLSDGHFSLGLAEPVVSHPSEVLAFAAQLSGLSSLAPSQERWLEGVIRQQSSRIHPCLHPSLLHGQVLTFAGCDRDLVDLIGITYDGQLAVLELKADEDIHLPLQALDYWTRVRWHLERGELQHLFPGAPIRNTAPLLFLVAPALSFHPAVTTVLRYFCPDIHVERVGVNTNWHDGLQVVMRLSGAASPQSQGNYEHHHGPSPHQKSDLDSQP